MHGVVTGKLFIAMSSLDKYEATYVATVSVAAIGGIQPLEVSAYARKKQNKSGDMKYDMLLQRRCQS
jgi:hypothetical protein